MRCGGIISTTDESTQCGRKSHSKQGFFLVGLDLTAANDARAYVLYRMPVCAVQSMGARPCSQLALVIVGLGSKHSTVYHLSHHAIQLHSTLLSDSVAPSDSHRDLHTTH